MKVPNELLPGDVTAICDTREQIPLELSPLRLTRDTLTTGDYSVKAFNRVVRKSLPDLLGGVGWERTRMDACARKTLGLSRSMSRRVNLANIEDANWRGNITPGWSSPPSSAGWLWRCRVTSAITHKLVNSSRSYWRGGDIAGLDAAWER